MPSHNQAEQYPVVKFFSNAVGLVVGMLATMPVYNETHGFFYQWVLRYIQPGFHNLLEFIWIFCVFYLLFTGAWLAISIVLGFITKTVIYVALKLNVRRKPGAW